MNNVNRKYNTPSDSSKHNTTGNHEAGKRVTYIKKPLHKTVLFALIRDPLIRAGTILASQRKDASSGKTEIRAFDRIKLTSNNQ